MIKRFLTILTFCWSFISADQVIYVDNDLDGVVDIYDKCLNTPFEFEVNKDGCPKDQDIFDLKTKISYTLTKHDHKTDEYRYQYISNSLNLTFQNSSYIFGISNSYLSIDYKDTIDDIVYEVNGYSDLSLELGYKFDHEYLYSINLINKFSTSREDSLTTGSNDHILELNLQHIFDTMSVYGFIAYNYLGDSEDVNYNNYIDLSLGFMKKYQNIYYGMSIYYAEPILESSNDQVDLQTTLSIPIDQNIHIGLSYISNILEQRSNDRRDSFSFKFSYSF